MIPIPASDFPIGTPVRVCDAWGTVLWEGPVTGHAGPYSVVVKNSLMAATSLLRPIGDPMDDMMAEFCAEIERLQARHAATVQALETYLKRTYSKPRPTNIDDPLMRALAGVVFDDHP